MWNERRADQRILARWTVEISGVDEAGMQFTERAQSIDASSEGCRFLLHSRVLPGGVIAVEPLGPNGENLADEFARLFVVVRTNSRDDLLEVGARSLLEDELCGSSLEIDCTKL